MHKYTHNELAAQTYNFVIENYKNSFINRNRFLNQVDEYFVCSLSSIEIMITFFNQNKFNFS